MDKDIALSSNLEVLTQKVLQLRRESKEFSKLMELNRVKVYNLVKAQLQKQCKCSCNRLQHQGGSYVAGSFGERGEQRASKVPALIHELMAADRKSREYHHILSQKKQEPETCGRDWTRSKAEDRMNIQSEDEPSGGMAKEKSNESLQQLLSTQMLELEHTRSMVKSKSSELASTKTKLLESTEENRKLLLRIRDLEIKLEGRTQNNVCTIAAQELEDVRQGIESGSNIKNAQLESASSNMKLGRMVHQEPIVHPRIEAVKKLQPCWTPLGDSIEFGVACEQEDKIDSKRHPGSSPESQEVSQTAPAAPKTTNGTKRHTLKLSSQAPDCSLRSSDADTQSLLDMIEEFDAILAEGKELTRKQVDHVSDLVNYAKHDSKGRQDAALFSKQISPDSLTASKAIGEKWGDLKLILLRLVKTTSGKTLSDAIVDLKLDLINMDDVGLPCAYEPSPEFVRASCVPRLDLSVVLLAGVETHIGQDDRIVRRDPFTCRSESSGEPVEMQRESSNPSISDSVVCGSMAQLQRDNLMMHQTIKELTEENRKLEDDLDGANNNICLLSKELYQKDDEKNGFKKLMMTQINHLKQENTKLGLEMKVMKEAQAQDGQLTLGAVAETIEQLMSIQENLLKISPKTMDHVAFEHKVRCEVCKDITATKDQLEGIREAVIRQQHSTKKIEVCRSRRMNDSSMSESHQFSIEKVFCSARECPQTDKTTESAFSHPSSSCSTTREVTDQDDMEYLQFDILHSGEH